MKPPNDKDYEKLGKTLAMCHVCSHIQPARDDFDCNKCRNDTFTKREWFDLKQACNQKIGKFIKLEKNTKEKGNKEV